MCITGRATCRGPAAPYPERRCLGVPRLPPRLPHARAPWLRGRPCAEIPAGTSTAQIRTWELGGRVHPAHQVQAGPSDINKDTSPVHHDYRTQLSWHCILRGQFEDPRAKVRLPAGIPVPDRKNACARMERTVVSHIEMRVSTHKAVTKCFKNNE